MYSEHNIVDICTCSKEIFCCVMHKCVLHVCAWVCTSHVFNIFTLRKERDKYMVFFHIFNAFHMAHNSRLFIFRCERVLVCVCVCVCGACVCVLAWKIFIRILFVLLWHARSRFGSLCRFLSLMCTFYVIPIHKNFYLDTVTNLQ